MQLFSFQRIVVVSLLLSAFSCVLAQRTEYHPDDSIRIEKMLKQAASREGSEHPMLYFGMQFAGIPYVAHTLENGTREHLIVNTRQLDCTTFVETCAALTLCDMQDRRTFADYCDNLRKLRYRNGRITDYTSRLHYFTQWGEDNQSMGIIKSVLEDAAFPSFSTQTIDIHYMSSHPEAYKQLKAHPQFVSIIRQQENALKGKKYPFLPKQKLNLPPEKLPFIHTGDIVAIITSKAGLDTSHVGIAVWQGRNLHLMHASSLYKKVVIDSKTFYDYSQNQRTQLGIRVFRICK